MEARRPPADARRAEPARRRRRRTPGRRLARLGFDSGRVRRHLRSAARPVRSRTSSTTPASTSTGSAAPTPCARSQVLARQTGTGPGITAVRELEALTARPARLADLRIVVGQFGGLSALTRPAGAGAPTAQRRPWCASDEPDAAAQAVAAEPVRRDGLHRVRGASRRPRRRSTTTRCPQFESVGGRALATRIAAARRTAHGPLDAEVSGMRLPILRETRMPAVLFTLGDALARRSTHGRRLVDAVVEALEAWASTTARVLIQRHRSYPQFSPRLWLIGHRSG